ncbi:MAG TPA: LLM class flavin-dependent oxidoreductase [Acidimicrobiia bacterium]|nr:LLM class flavin-dependent oxidoreductase [Acidimicrobiia bacterium]
MEFGIFVQGHFPPSKRAVATDPAEAEHRMLLDEVEIVRAADRAGFKYVWATEHHFLDEYSHLSANEVFLSFCAGVTERIHLGSGIFNITAPVNHPARVAERVAMLDHLSNGRFEFGTGRGSSTTEQRGFGIDDPAETREWYDETIGEFVKMWAPGDYAHDGARWSMPTRTVLPKPWSKPHPPMWVAAGSPSTYERAAQLGLGVLGFNVGSADDLRPHVQAYKHAIRDARPVGAFVNDNVMITGVMICAETTAEARALATRSGVGYLQSLVFRYLDTFPRPDGIPEWPALIPEPTADDFEWRIDAGLMVCGDPDECAAQIERKLDIGFDQFCFSYPIGLSAEESIRSIDLFGREVLPRFDTDPMHRSTRNRLAALG